MVTEPGQVDLREFWYFTEKATGSLSLSWGCGCYCTTLLTTVTSPCSIAKFLIHIATICGTPIHIVARRRLEHILPFTWRDPIVWVVGWVSWVEACAPIHWAPSSGAVAAETMGRCWWDPTGRHQCCITKVALTAEGILQEQLWNCQCHTLCPRLWSRTLNLQSFPCLCTWA